MHDQPLVSIICLSMNHEKYVRQSFESVVNQTYSNFEIIFVDNNSRDNTFELGNDIFLKSGRPYKGFKREKNYSITQNINFLIQNSSGKYLALQSGDDWWDLTNIEEKVAFYEQNQQFGLVYSNGYFYYEETGEMTLPTNLHKFKHGYIFEEVLTGGIYFPIGYLMRRDIFDTIGYYDESLAIDDWDIWLRILQHFPIGYFDKPLVYYRRHDSNFCGNIEVNFWESKKIVQKYKHHHHYNTALEMCTRSYLYGLSMHQPSINTVKKILKYFKFQPFYFRQLIKVLLVMGKLYPHKAH